MVKKYKKWILGIVFLMILACIAVVVYIRVFDSAVKENPITEDDFLKIEGQKVTNRKGEEILLKGTNLGGWLLQEYWMCPVKGSDKVEQWSNSETLDVLTERFGEEKTQELINEFQDNWITEDDIQNIVKAGCNVIRVPFWYRNFMKDAEGTWLTEQLDDNPGIKRLDWVIETAQKYGIYVILDMHGCPGGQSYNHSTGSARTCELFQNEQYQATMEKLWTAIADRYKDNPAIAAYDIMNEAQEYKGDVQSDPRNQVYDRMIKAIRGVDGNHIITVEGIWGLDALPDPKEAGWDNVMYQVHYYNVNDEGTAENMCKELGDYKKQYNIPIYLGEFSYMGFADACEEEKIHYTTWTYKGCVEMDGTWFMYYRYLEPADVYQDSYDQIKEKWGKSIQTRRFTEETSITKYF